MFAPIMFINPIPAIQAARRARERGDVDDRPMPAALKCVLFMLCVAAAADVVGSVLFLCGVL